MKHVPLTHEEHLDLADDLACAEHYLMKVAKKVEDHYPLKHPVVKTMDKVDPRLAMSFKTLCTALENAYYEVSTTLEVEQDGCFPYSNLEARYNKLVNDVNIF